MASDTICEACLVGSSQSLPKEALQSRPARPRQPVPTPVEELLPILKLFATPVTLLQRPHLHRTRYIPRTRTLTQTRTTPPLKPHIRLARRLREQHWRRRLDRTFEAPCWLYAVTPPASDTSLRIRCWVPPGRKQRSHRRGHGLENSFLYSLKRLPMQGLVCCGM
jgi:hypothetical protein